MMLFPLDLRVYYSITAHLCIEVNDTWSQYTLHYRTSTVEYFLLRSYQAF